MKLSRELEKNVKYNLTQILIKINQENTKDISLLQRKYGTAVHNIIRHAAQEAYLIGHNYVAQRKRRTHETFIDHEDLNQIIKQTDKAVDIFWRRVKYVVHKRDTVQTITKTRYRSASLDFGNILQTLATRIISEASRLGTQLHDFLIPPTQKPQAGPAAEPATTEEEAPDEFATGETLTWNTMSDERTCPVCQDLDGETWQAGDPDIPEPITDTHEDCRCTLSVEAA